MRLSGCARDSARVDRRVRRRPRPAARPGRQRAPRRRPGISAPAALQQPPDSAAERRRRRRRSGRCRRAAEVAVQRRQRPAPGRQLTCSDRRRQRRRRLPRGRERRRHRAARADRPGRRSEPFGGRQPAALQLARPLAGVRNVLSDLRLVLFLLCAGGIALAACLGRLAARRVLAPLAEVAADRAAHHRHRRPDQPHPVPRRRRGRPARDPLQRDDRAAPSSRAARSTSPCAPSASSSPTPRTSCALRSRACGRTSRC